jgi:hypothetical protein
MEIAIKNQRGSIILNTLIYSAMVLFMSMMLLEFVKGHIYGQFAHIQKLNFEILKSNVGSALRRNDICANGLYINGVKALYPGPDPNKVSLTNIVSNGQNILSLNQPLGAGMIVSSIDILPDAANPPVVTGSETIYTTKLILQVKKNGATFGGVLLDNSSDPIIMSITADASGNISSCSSSLVGSLDVTGGEQCDASNLSFQGNINGPGGVILKKFYMVKMHNGASTSSSGAGGVMRFFCMTPQNSTMGYVHICLENVNCP